MKLEIGRRPHLFALLALLGVGLIAALPAQAGLVIAATNSSAIAGSSGNAFDITLSNTGLSAQDITGFAFQISVTDPDISFNDVLTSTSTVLPYIFAGDSFVVINGFPLASLNGPQILNASDLTNSGNAVSLGAGATLGLAHVIFNVANLATPGAPTVTIANDVHTSFAGGPPNFDVVDFTATNGTITIAAASGVPEPSTIVYMLGAVPVLFFAHQRFLARSKQ